MKTFYEWLEQYLGQDSIFGDLADDSRRDSLAPKTGGYEEWKERMAGTDAQDAFDLAWTKYENER